MHRHYSAQCGSLALAVSISVPIFIAASFVAGFGERSLGHPAVWMVDAVRLATIGGVAGVALAALGLISNSGRRIAVLALLLSVFNLAVGGLMFTS